MPTTSPSKSVTGDFDEDEYAMMREMDDPPDEKQERTGAGALT